MSFQLVPKLDALCSLRLRSFLFGILSSFSLHFSTETALLLVHNDIIRVVNRGDLVPLVLLDLSAAFDTVDHGCLLSILERRFCVDGDALEWFKSYLSDRSHTYIAGEDITVRCL